MLKHTGFAKARAAKIHINAFNPLTLSAATSDALSQVGELRNVDAPDYEGSGAVHIADPAPKSDQADI